MRTVTRLAVLTLALALAPAARAEQKLGYVDFQRAIKEVEEGKAAGAALKRDFDEKQKQLNGKSEEVKRLQEEFQKQAALLTPEAKAAKGAEIERKMMETQEFYVKLQQDLSGKEREAMRPLADKMTAIVREIAEAEGFTMVFDRDSAGLIWAPTSLDLTNELIRKYNAKYPAGAAKKADGAAKKADAPKADAPKK
ncbi:MAG: OmpH family outer membrane protein [Anaeromyxobacter sp.]|nr:OmpH family outer membrane protein [Anaeromyxobacter sp.]MBL0277275.1 OmpH family outer membrane protein [Anaeromyxobacter sp.]